jgi:hypothetical protein
MYDAVFPFGLLTKRVTYYLQPDAKILHVSDNLLNPKVHLDELKKFISCILPEIA